MDTCRVCEHLAARGAQIFLVPNGSPYESDKQDERQKLARMRVKETGLPLVYLNQIGGQDELVFDGASFVLDAQGNCVAQAAAWEEDILFTQWDLPFHPPIHLLSASDWAPSRLPLRRRGVKEWRWSGYLSGVLKIEGRSDYVNKNGFPGVVIGLSGGIDSALVAVLAVDALGADKVWR